MSTSMLSPIDFVHPHPTRSRSGSADDDPPSPSSGRSPLSASFSPHGNSATGFQSTSHPHPPPSSNINLPLNLEPQPASNQAVNHYGLNPHVFALPSHSLQFIMPSFAQGGPAQPFSDGPAYSEAPVLRYPASSKPFNSFENPSDNMSSTNSLVRQDGSLGLPTRRSSQTSLQLDPSRPIYSLYGHSVQNVNPDLTAFPPQPPKPPSDESSSRESSPFDPSRIGLPLPVNCNYTNLYSSSGFDLMRALAYVVNRPNPQIDIGPVDTSTALVVVDARKPDLPIIHVSTSFSVLTGYENWEICGRNCRVLQSPPTSEPVTKGSKRKYSDPTAAYHMKAHIMAGKESQSSIVNYRKNGEPFVNLVTVIPITWGSDEIAYYIGFQVDLVQQPNAILSQKAHGTYMTHHNMSTKVQGRIVPLPEEAPRIEEINLPPALLQPAPRGRPPLQIQASISNPRLTAVPDIQSLRSDFKTVLNENRDLVMVVSLKGTLFYVSAACQSMLGYEEEELVNQNISSFCHTGDLTGVLRQLKEAGNTAHTPIDMIFRAVTKSRTFWMEAQGQLHVEAGKGRKYVVLVGRERILTPLSWQAIYSRGGLGDCEFWTKLSLDGMCLYSTASVREVLGFSSDAMLGKMMSRMAPVAQKGQIMKAIRDAWSGSIVITLAVSLTSRDGGLVECMADFYPPRLAPLSQLDATSADSDPMSGPSSSNSAAVPPVVYCQINEIASANRRAIAMPSPSASPHQPLSNQVPASDGLANPSLVLANPVNQTSPGSEKCLIKSLPTTGNTFAFSESKDNVFNELDTSKKTAWNFELSELKIHNKALRAELATKRQKEGKSLSNEAAKQVRLAVAHPKSKHYIHHVESRNSRRTDASSFPENRPDCGGCGTPVVLHESVRMPESMNASCENCAVAATAARHAKVLSKSTIKEIKP